MESAVFESVQLHPVKGEHCIIKVNSPDFQRVKSTCVESFFKKGGTGGWIQSRAVPIFGLGAKSIDSLKMESPNTEK